MSLHCPSCHSLRVKLFLPLAVVSLAMLAYVQLVWAPSAIEYNKNFYHRMQARQLNNIAEGLIPLMLADQLAEIHASLDNFKEENPDWLALELFNTKGQRLYPLEPPRVKTADPDVDTHEHPITLEGRPLGMLRVTENHRHLLADIRAAHRSLVLVLLVVPVALFLILAVVLEVAVSRPVGKLAEASQKLADGQFDAVLPKASQDEVGQLVRSFASMREDIRRTQAELLQLNATLERRVQEEVAQNREKDLLLIQQSRLAAMGEMVHNIAHQWRQPLNALALVVRNIKDDYDYGELKEESLNRSVATAQNLLNRMSTTIDDFRDFFRPDQEMKAFDLAEEVRAAAAVMEAAYRNNGIELELDLQSGLTADGYASRYSQAVLNILANAKEVIQSRGIGAGHVTARLAEAEGWGVLTVDDNGGGVSPDVLPKIFDPYFTTKEQGSGIGLYMTKMIIEKNMNGHVAAANVEKGARLTISVPLQKAP